GLTVVAELVVRVLEAQADVPGDVVDQGGAPVADRGFRVAGLDDDVAQVAAHEQAPRRPPVEVGSQIARRLAEAPRDVERPRRGPARGRRGAALSGDPGLDREVADAERRADLEAVVLVGREAVDAGKVVGLRSSDRGGARVDHLVAPLDVPLQGHAVALAVVSVPAQAELVAPARPPERLEVATGRAVRQAEALEVDGRYRFASGAEGQLRIRQDLKACKLDAERVGNVG